MNCRATSSLRFDSNCSIHQSNAFAHANEAQAFIQGRFGVETRSTIGDGEMMLIPTTCRMRRPAIILALSFPNGLITTWLVFSNHGAQKMPIRGSLPVIADSILRYFQHLESSGSQNLCQSPLGENSYRYGTAEGDAHARMVRLHHDLCGGCVDVVPDLLQLSARHSHRRHGARESRTTRKRHSPVRRLRGGREYEIRGFVHAAQAHRRCNVSCRQ